MKYVNSEVRQLIEQELQEFFGKRRQDKWKSIAGTITGDPYKKAVSGLGEEEVRRAVTKAGPLEFHGGIQNMLTQNILKILSRDASGLLEGQPQPLGGVPPRADAGPIATRRAQTPPSGGAPTATVTLKAEEVFARLNNVPPETQSAFLTSLTQILNSQFGEHIRFAAEEQAAPAGHPIVELTMKWLKDIQSGEVDKFMREAVDINESGAAYEFVELLLADVAKRGGLEEEDAGKGVPDEMLNRLLSAVQERFDSLGASAPTAAAAGTPAEASRWRKPASLHGLGSPARGGPTAGTPNEELPLAKLHGLGAGPSRDQIAQAFGGKDAPAAAGKPKGPTSSRGRDRRLAKLKGFEAFDTGPGRKGTVSSQALLDLDLEAEDEDLLGDFLRKQGYEITEAQIKRMKEIAGIK